MTETRQDPVRLLGTVCREQTPAFMTFAESQRFKQLLIGKGGDGETREEQPKNNSAGVAKILALYVPETERQLGGGAH